MPAADAPSSAPRRGWWIALALAPVAVSFALNAFAPPFSPDSWGYFELAHSFAADPYAIGTWRGYASAIPYSSSFPPLWPLLIAGADRLLDLGIHSGYLLTAAVFLAFALVAESTTRAAFGRRWLGGASALLLFAFPPFQVELLAARAIPLQLLLVALLLRVLVSDGPRPLLSAAALGALGGAVLMARFDALFMAAGLVLATPWLLRDWRALPLAALAALAVTAPWVLYSLSHFDRVFATDNALVALSVDPREFVTNFHVVPPLSAGEAPRLWLWKLVLHVPALVGAVLLVMLNALPVSVLGVSAVRRHGRSAIVASLCEAAWWRQPQGRLSFLLALSLLPVGAYLITGYFDARYFSAPVWLCALAALLALADAARPGDARLFAICGALALVLATKPSVDVARKEGRVWLERPHLAFDPALRDGREFEALVACLDPMRPDVAVLFADATTAARFGALSGHRGAMLPRNWAALDRAEVAAFLQRFDVGYAAPDPRLRLPEGLGRPAAGACSTRLIVLTPGDAGAR